MQRDAQIEWVSPIVYLKLIHNNWACTLVLFQLPLCDAWRGDETYRIVVVVIIVRLSEGNHERCVHNRWIQYQAIWVWIHVKWEDCYCVHLERFRPDVASVDSIQCGRRCELSMTKLPRRHDSTFAAMALICQSYYINNAMWSVIDKVDSNSINITIGYNSYGLIHRR
jgi:hypothetical protein